MRTLLIGDTAAQEFRPVAEFLRRETDLSEVANLTEAMNLVDLGSFAPEAVVLAQDRPGLFGDSDLEALRRAAPLARFLGLLGSWCEGERRTGQPWPGMIRTYWHQWLARWSRDFLQGTGGDLRWWGLPDTVGDDERLMQLAEVDWPERQGLIAVCSRSFDIGDYLVEACAAGGYSAMWVDPRKPRQAIRPQVVVWDGVPDELRAIEKVRQQFPAASIVVLLDFPRIDDVTEAVRRGAAAVLSKPLRVEDLLFELDRLSTPGEFVAPSSKASVV